MLGTGQDRLKRNTVEHIEEMRRPNRACIVRQRIPCLASEFLFFGSKPPDMNAWWGPFLDEYTYIYIYIQLYIHNHTYRNSLSISIYIYIYVYFDWLTRDTGSWCYNVDWCKLDDISQVYAGSQGGEVHGVLTGPSQTFPQKISFQPTKGYLYPVTIRTMCEEFLSCVHQWHRTLILLVPIFGGN